MFSHEKLSVYQRALSFVASLEPWWTQWDTSHSFVDHLSRASRSIVLNIVESSRVHVPRRKAVRVDYAVGSTLEYAGCLDIANAKEVLDESSLMIEKEKLSEITRMLIGLRKAWKPPMVREEVEPYSARPGSDKLFLFHHEGLEVYQTALRFMRWYATDSGLHIVRDRISRDIDRTGTSMVLNIAEGNGRFSRIDTARFLGIAEASARKASAYLDIAVQKDGVNANEVNAGKELLWRVANMLKRLSESQKRS
jgi:four helix bundle protein